MRRLALSPRPGWERIAEENGFSFHHVNGELYWDESAAYAFTLKEIEQGLEDPAQELADMCLDLAAEIVGSEELLGRLAIPPAFWELIRDSWQRREPSLYGRFDFAFDGTGPAKLYEYNADTPTSLYESAYFQWNWLEDAIHLGRIPEGADQFNSIQEKLIETFASFEFPSPMHFACMKDTDEDRVTTEYLMDCAAQAGLRSQFVYMEDIGIEEQGLFVDLAGAPVTHLFKLYPWEYVWRDAFAGPLLTCDTTFVEPPWKMVLSNKGILPLLWERHPHHPNLLPAWFHSDARFALERDYVLKPLLSREGANIRLFRDRAPVFQTGGEYGAEGYIGQKFHPTPDIGGHHPMCGVWIVGGKACGLGVREDDSPVTGDLARFVPHFIEP